MQCPKCGSENVSVQILQAAAKSKTRAPGILYTLGRWLMIFFTLGLWAIIGRRTGTTTTTFKQRKVAVCQACGHQWNLKT